MGSTIDAKQLARKHEFPLFAVDIDTYTIVVAVW